MQWVSLYFLTNLVSMGWSPPPSPTAGKAWPQCLGDPDEVRDNVVVGRGAYLQDKTTMKGGD